MKKEFTATQLITNILINIMLYGKKKHDKAMSKVACIISKLVFA